MYSGTRTILIIAALSINGACSKEDPLFDAGGNIPDATSTVPDAAAADARLDLDAGPDAGADAADAADAGQIATVLTLVGSSPLRGATVRAEVAGRVFTTVADGEGHFRLEVDSEEVDQLVVLYARGAASLDETHLELASISRSVAVLTALAGDDLILGQEEEGTLDLSEFSTVRYAVMYAGAGGAVPVTREQLITAELAMPEPLWSSEMDDVLGLLHAILTGTEELGTWTTTLELMRDMYAVLERIEPVLTDFSNPELLAAPRSLAAFEASGLSRHFEDFLVQRGDWVGRAGRRWDFDPSGRGVADSRLFFAPLDRVSFSWSIDQEGVLEIVLDTPAPGSVDLDQDAIVALLSDPTERAMAENFLQGGGAQVLMDVLRIQVRRFAGFERTDWVVKSGDLRYRLNETFAPFGLTLTDAEGRRTDQTDIWTRAEDLPLLPFTAEDVAGDWMFEVPRTADMTTLNGEFQPGDQAIVDAYVHLDPDGSASIEGGFTDSPVTAQWALESDGRLLITHPNSIQHWISWIVDKTPEQGFLHELALPGTNVTTHYQRARRVDTQTHLDESLLITGPDNYWQSTINLYIDHLRRDGSHPEDTVFGFNLPGGEVMNRVEFANPGDPPSIDQSWNATISEGRVTFEQRYNRALATRCTKADPSCFTRRRRTWEPVAYDGAVLYVLERETWISEWASWRSDYTWSDIQNAWVHDTTGQIMNPDDRVYFIPPRLNAYYLQPIP